MAEIHLAEEVQPFGERILRSGIQLELVADAVVVRPASVQAIRSRREERNQRRLPHHPLQRRLAKDAALPRGAEENVRRAAARLDGDFALLRGIAAADLVRGSGRKL